MNRSKIAVIGCGYWGSNHARTLFELGGLAAVSDINVNNARKISEKFNVPQMSVNEILTNEAIDGVIFALPPHLHVENAIAALNAGKHILVEKPISLNSKDAARIVAIADKAGKVAMTGHVLRYHPAFEKMVEILKAGDLGKLNYIHSHRVGLGKFHPKNDALWDIAPHDLSLILAITGEKPMQVYGEGSATLNHLNDVSHLHLEFPSGIKAHILVSRLHPYRERRLTLIGSKAMVSFDDVLPWEQKLALYHHKIWEDDTGWNSEMLEPEYIPVKQSMPLHAELEDFLTCIETGSMPRVPISDGLDVIKILEAGSAKHGKHQQENH